MISIWSYYLGTLVVLFSIHFQPVHYIHIKNPWCQQIFLNCIKRKNYQGQYQNLAKNSQPDVDHRPSWRFLGRRWPDWAFLLVDVDYPDVFNWSTSTRLSFSTGWPSWHFLGRRRPDWGFLLVDIYQLKTSVWKPQYGLNYSYLALALA